MGGEGKNKQYKHPNLVMLTAREHYIAHALLWLIHRNREMAISFKLMHHVTKSKNIISSRIYEEVKIYLKNNRVLFIKKKWSHSPESKRKLSEFNKGKKMSPESIAKRQESRKKNRLLGIKIRRRAASPETKRKMSETRKGRKLSPESIAKRSETFKKNRLLGITKMKVVSPETKRKMSEAHKGKKMSPESIAKGIETKKRNRLLELGQKLGHSVQVKI
jgi:hypothetical protein